MRRLERGDEIVLGFSRFVGKFYRRMSRLLDSYSTSLRNIGRGCRLILEDG